MFKKYPCQIPHGFPESARDILKAFGPDFAEAYEFDENTQIEKEILDQHTLVDHYRCRFDPGADLCLHDTSVHQSAEGTDDPPVG